MEIRLNALMTHWDLCFIIIVFCEIKIVDFTDIFRLKKLVATWVCTEISRNVSVKNFAEFRKFQKQTFFRNFGRLRNFGRFPGIWRNFQAFSQ